MAVGVGVGVQVRELQALRQQLEPEVDIPQLQPLRDEVEGLDQLLGALQQLQVGSRQHCAQTGCGCGCDCGFCNCCICMSTTHIVSS